MLLLSIVYFVGAHKGIPFNLRQRRTSQEFGTTFHSGWNSDGSKKCSLGHPSLYLGLTTRLLTPVSSFKF